MKEITILCPIFNEQENIELFIKNFTQIFKNHPNYKFSILFADNASSDSSSQLLKNICKDFRFGHLLQLIPMSFRYHKLEKFTELKV